MTWQNINTAPKDGTAILVCVKGYSRREDLGAHPIAVRWTSYYGLGIQAFRNKYGHIEKHITHWMTLPEED